MERLEKIGDVISRLVKRLKIEKKLKEYKAIEQWSNVVGKIIAHKTKPTKVENGMLFVKVESPIWMSELSMRKDDIRKALNKSLGRNIIKDIKFSLK